MLSLQQNRNASLPEAVADRIDGFDFALLGLRANEARASIIRRAASKAARRISASAADPLEGLEMRSYLAVSTYRLLDPRRRTSSFERIQLSVFSEEDREAQRRSRKPILTPADSAGKTIADPRVILAAELVA